MDDNKQNIYAISLICKCVIFSAWQIMQIMIESRCVILLSLQSIYNYLKSVFLALSFVEV